MRIPSVEQDPKPSLNLPLDPKVVDIIEKMALKPSVIEKLLLTAQNKLLIDLVPANVAQKLSFNQLSLPLNASSELASVAQSQKPISVQVNVTNGQVVLKLFDNENLSKETLKLIFKNAQLLDGNLLKLTSQVNKALPKALVPNQALDSQASSMKVTNEQGQATQLQQAISSLLKIRPANPSALSDSLNKLFQLEEKLTVSFNQKLEGPQGSRLKLEQLEHISLSKNDVNQLLSKIMKLMPNEKIAKELMKLLATIENLKLAIDFSKQNKQIKIEQRIQSSGNFLESKIANADVTKQSGTFDESSASYKRNSAAELPDLKVNLLTIKQAVRSLLQMLSSSNSSPIHSRVLISILEQHPELAQDLRRTTKEGSRFNFQHSAPLTSGGATSNFFEKNEFSTQLKNTILNNLQLMASNQANNVKLENNLLNLQKQILTEFLNEANALISKIETNQLLSLRSETPHLQQYLLDLPIYHNKQVQSFELLFTANKDAEQSKTDKIWTVTIKFDLEPLGPIFARVRLKNDRISTHFFAKEAETASLLSEHLDHLKDSLFLAGLDIEEINGQQGVVPEQLLVNDEHSIDLHV